MKEFKFKMGTNEFTIRITSGEIIMIRCGNIVHVEDHAGQEFYTLRELLTQEVYRAIHEMTEETICQ